MKGIILAAGYATRLYPLTLTFPKAMLEIGGKPIMNYIASELCSIDAVDEIFIVTNGKFENFFFKWADNHASSFTKSIKVISDGTMTEDDRLGAIGDIEFIIEKEKIDDELLIIAGDNFFTYKLRDYYDFYRQKGCDCVCAKRMEDKKKLTQMGVAILDENNRLLEIQEKPEHPKSDTAVFASYIYTKDTCGLFKKYLEEGNKPDAPGYFLEWLYKRKEIYAYVFDEECYDIGTLETYNYVCEKYK
ncbi:MAG: nucleotidyltransferase family protein [Firmicutes bacterium]|nr:nucleotidyltransferase family protein [Bacillota bacterium]MBR0104187.1 nucleotidyltransferase family protein [Bacillota bacterium]